MKKIMCVVFFLLLCVSLVGCDPGSYSFDYEVLLDKVVGVELIDYENEKQKKFSSWVPNHLPDLVPFDLSKMTLLETLDNENLDAFLKQLSEIGFLHKYYTYNSPKGICIRLLYENGNFEIISGGPSYGGYVGSYSSSGEVVDFVGAFANHDSFTYLINDYFETKLE